MKFTQNTYKQVELKEVIPFCQKKFKELKKIFERNAINLSENISFDIRLAETQDRDNYQCTFMVIAMIGDKYARLKPTKEYPVVDSPWILYSLLVWTKTTMFYRKCIPGTYMYDEEYRTIFLKSMRKYVDMIKKFGLEPYTAQLDFELVTEPVGPQ